MSAESVPMTYDALKTLADKYDADMYYPDDPDATTLNPDHVGEPEAPFGDMPTRMVYALERQGAIQSDWSFNSNPTNKEMRTLAAQIENKHVVNIFFRVDFEAQPNTKWDADSPIQGGRIFGARMETADDQMEFSTEAVHLLTKMFAQHGASVNEVKRTDRGNPVWRAFLD